MRKRNRYVKMKDRKRKKRSKKRGKKERNQKKREKEKRKDDLLVTAEVNFPVGGGEAENMLEASHADLFNFFAAEEIQ